MYNQYDLSKFIHECHNIWAWNIYSRKLILTESHLALFNPLAAT
jgi:hypothetical protein